MAAGVHEWLIEPLTKLVWSLRVAGSMLVKRKQTQRHESAWMDTISFYINHASGRWRRKRKLSLWESPISPTWMCLIHMSPILTTYIHLPLAFCVHLFDCVLSLGLENTVLVKTDSPLRFRVPVGCEALSYEKNTLKQHSSRLKTEVFGAAW